MGRWLISWVSHHLFIILYIVNYGVTYYFVGLLRRGAWKSPVKNGMRAILIEALMILWTFRVMIKALPQISEVFFLIGLKLCCLKGLPRLMFTQLRQRELDLSVKSPRRKREWSASPPVYHPHCNMLS